MKPLPWQTMRLLLSLFAAIAFAQVNVTIQEWDVPTPYSHPHDPAAGPNASLWYTGQASNRLGRLDPATGIIDEFEIDFPDSGPHGLVADAKGDIWYTGNRRGFMGRLNPLTREFTRYPMPDERARDPHTPIFDKQGILWFTVQGGNFVGKLDPADGSVVLKESPTPRSRPYGIVIDPDGLPVFCEFGTNKIARIDPRTFEITEFELPAGARPRRIAVTGDKRIYYTDYARGYLGRLDPATSEVKEWRSPSGERSEPYGIAATPDGIVWYSESGVQPNTLVRFDPATETFQRWDVPSGGGVLRHIVATEDGKLYLACSGVNKVGVVTVTAGEGK